MSTFLWVIFALAYLTALIVLGMATLRKGHTALFCFGILVPFLWIVGALMAPTPEAAAADARTTSNNQGERIDEKYRPCRVRRNDAVAGGHGQHHLRHRHRTRPPVPTRLGSAGRRSQAGRHLRLVPITLGEGVI